MNGKKGRSKEKEVKKSWVVKRYSKTPSLVVRWNQRAERLFFLVLFFVLCCSNVAVSFSPLSVSISLFHLSTLLYREMSTVFPLLRALGKVSHFTEVQTRAVGKAQQILFGSVGSNAQKCTTSHGEVAALRCRYRVCDAFEVPMSFIGSCQEHGDNMILAHVPGLPGAFPVSTEELHRHKSFFLIDNSRDDWGSATVNNADDMQLSECVQLSLLCVMEALETEGGGASILDKLLSLVRRRAASLRGSELLLATGSRINEGGLELSFPYHCGNSHASKRYFDISQEACTLFGPHVKHGTKMLCRYGTAVVVGVAPEESLGCPVPFWNPLGAPAACLAPVFSGCPAIPVGEVKLEYNGPTTSSSLLDAEDASRYLNPTVDGRFDVSSWLNEGLFGVKVGQPVEDGCVAHGVCYDLNLCEFVLFVRELSSGEVRPSSHCLLK